MLTLFSPKVLSVLKRDRQGIVALEYALISAICAVTLIVSLEPLGVSMAHVFQNVNSAIAVALSEPSLNTRSF